MVVNGQRIWRGSGPADGDPQQMSSTRSELYGEASALEFIHQFASFHNITIAASIVLFCDNTGAVSYVNEQRKKKLPLPVVTQLQHKFSRRRRLGINSDIKAIIATTLSSFTTKV